MKTTLNKIRVHNPCTDGWKKLLKNLGKTMPDDEPLLITTILDSNGLDDALWCLRAVDGCQKEMRLYAVDYARSVQHLMADARSTSAIDVAERYAYGLATDAELAAVMDVAWDVARDAASAAELAAARAAAMEAEWDAARAAARATAMDAAWGAGAAASATERVVQGDMLRSVCTEIEQREVS